MGKMYVGTTGKKYKVMPWGIAKTKHERIMQLWRVSCQLPGSLSWIRYPRSAYYSTPEEAERELDTLATRRGWTVCS